jgi:hypothetical protein
MTFVKRSNHGNKYHFVLSPSDFHKNYLQQDYTNIKKAFYQCDEIAKRCDEMRNCLC